MIELMWEPFQLEFMQRALVAGLVAVITTSIIGTWVVLRGLTFLGDALAHGVVPGIAAAQLLALPVGMGAMASVLVMVLGIEAVRRTERLSEDVGIGLLFVGMLALGVVIISRSDAFSQDLTALLFGDVLGVKWSGISMQVLIALVVVGGSVLMYRPFLVLALDATKAELLGQQPRRTHLVMLVLISLAVVSSFRVVGALLVFGLMVAPPATAVLLVRRVPSIMVMAAALGSLSVVVGLLVSYHHDTATSATMAGCSVVLFMVVLCMRFAAETIGRTSAARRACA